MFVQLKCNKIHSEYNTRRVTSLSIIQVKFTRVLETDEPKTIPYAEPKCWFIPNK